MKSKKKSIVLGAITLLLCLAVFLNVNLQQDIDSADIPTLSGNETGVVSRNLGEAVLVGETATDVPVPTGVIAQGDASDFFVTAKLSRREARDEAVSLLQSTIENEKTSKESKKDAEETIAVMASYALKEANIESMVMAKGFEECVAMLGDDGLNIIVASTGETLSPEEVARIRDIATAETSLSPSRIKIVKNS